MQLRRSLFSLFCLGLFFSCGGGSETPVFVVTTTEEAVSSVSPVVVRGDWLVYFASEAMTGAGGTMFNGDGDTSDDVAFVVNMVSGAKSNTGVAAFQAEVIGSEIYLAVRESDDGVDWNGSGTADPADFVLLHYSEASDLVSFVETLDISALDELPFVNVSGRLYFTRQDSPTLADESSLRFVDTLDPTVSSPVFNEMGFGMSEPELVFEDQGLIFLSMDETDTSQDYNQDGDQLDTSVLALLDAGNAGNVILNTELALPSSDGPFDAFPIGLDDWNVAFLVDEAAQGAMNFNAQANFTNPLLPASCTDDTDATDQILFFLDFSEFVAGNAMGVSTGIPGNDRVIAAADFVATLADETDCDFNEDGDTSDTMARWSRLDPDILPVREPELLRAVDTNLPGGSMGIALLSGVLVAAIDEDDDSEDINARGGMADTLLGWIDPEEGTAATWTFQHQAPSPFDTVGTGIFDLAGASEPFAGASWMAEDSQSGRLGIAFQESIPAGNPNIVTLNNNLNCGFEQKDADSLDSIPVWADFPGVPGFGSVLDFDGIGYAIDASDAGIVIARGFAFFRVDEAADNRDYNNDGVANDFVLFRNPLSACAPVSMATSSNIDGPSIITDGLRGAAFLSSEAQAGIDFNGDGDTQDLVIRFFLI